MASDYFRPLQAHTVRCVEHKHREKTSVNDRGQTDGWMDGRTDEWKHGELKYEVVVKTKL